MTSLFISYRRKELSRLRPLLDAFDSLGVEYWLDMRDTEPFVDFNDAVVRAISQAKAFLAWYSQDYPVSRACQWEFTAAFLAAQQEVHPFQRVLVINPEIGHDHLLLPQEICGQNIRSAPRADDAEGFQTLAREIANHLKNISSPFGQIHPGATPPYYGRKITHSERFVGRLKDFWKLHWALHNGSPEAITASAPAHLVQLIGLGGIGKSMFAEEYAARYGWAYPGGVFWLQAYGSEGKTPERAESLSALRSEQFEAVATQLGIETTAIDKPFIPHAVRRKLEACGEQYLWIVDDLPGGLDFKEVDEWAAPDTSHGKTLITTRTSSYKNRGNPLWLQPLDRDAAYRLLTREAEPEGGGEMDAARGIAGDLGGHPLALELAAAFIESHSGLMTFSEYRELLSDPGEDVLKLAECFVDVLPLDHQRSIAATMHHSLQQVGEEGLDFLRLASQLSPAPIPAPLVAATFEMVDGIDALKAKQRAALSFSQTEKHSLSQLVAPKLGLRIVHALVARVIRFDAAQQPRCAALRSAAVDFLVGVLEGVDVAEILKQQLLEQQISHARELVKHLATENDARLAMWVAEYDFRRGQYPAARTLQEKVFRLLESLLGKEHPDTLTSMNNLAETLRALGDLGKARSFHEEALEIRRRLFGEEHADTLVSMSNFAAVLTDQEDLARARDVNEQTLEILQGLRGEEDPATLTSMNNLAETLLALGDAEGARVLHEKVLEVRRRILGDEDRRTVLSMDNLAETLRAEGDLHSARALHEKALEIYKRTMGEEHPETLHSLNHLAGILREQREIGTARSLQEKSLEISCRVLGEEHPATLLSMTNLAQILKEQWDFPGARALQEKALHICRRTFGEEHPETAVQAFDLFCTLLDSDSTKEAQQVFHSNLAWLAKRDPATLEAEQRSIRARLPILLQSIPDLAS